jgi:hypothetical protein
LPQAIDIAGEKDEGAVDGFGRGQVHPGAFQGIEGIERAARFQELQVTLRRARFTVEDVLSEGMCT